MIISRPLWLLSVLALCSTLVAASPATEKAKARIMKERDESSPDFDGLLESKKKVRASVARFHLGEHLKKPTHHEIRQGITVSERFKNNPHLIRRDRAVPPNPDWETVDTPVIKPYEEKSPPGQYPVSLTENIDTMPIGSGPGVFPGFPEGTLGFWEGDEHARQMWEVIACPVADVAGFLSNPLRCFFGTISGDNEATSNPYEFFQDIFKNTNAISNVVTDIVVDTAVDIIVGILPADLFADIFDALCPLFEIIKGIADFLGFGSGGLGDTDGDGCFLEDIPLVGSFLATFSPVGIAACAIEDARLLSEIDKERHLQDLAVDQQLCDIDPVADGPTEVNPSGYAFCNNPDGSANTNFRCMKFMYSTNPEAPGVCLQTTIVDRIAKGTITLGLPFQLKLFHAVTQKYSSQQIELALDAIQTAVGEDGPLAGKVDAVGIEVDATRGELNAANTKLDAIQVDLQTIKTNTAPARRRLAETKNGTKAFENTKKQDEHTEVPPTAGEKDAFFETVEKFLNGHKEDLHKNAQEHGVPSEIADGLIKKLLSYTKGTEMKEARTFIEEDLKSSLQDPKVVNAIAGKLRGALGEDRGKEFVKEASVQILKMAKNKKTGKIDVRKLNAIKEDLDDFISKGKNDDATDWSATDGLPRFLAGDIVDTDFCEIGGIEGFRALLKSFIAPAVCDVLTLVSGGIEVVGQTSIANKIFELTNFWEDSGPFSALLGGLVEIFQFVAAIFLFGSDNPIDPATGELLPDSAIIDQLPSRGRILPIRQTNDSPPQVYMASGCDSNFEGELVFYGQIEGVVSSTLKALSEAVGQWLNAPIELVKWLLEQLFGLFKHMNGVCEYLDGFVQLALVEATFENSRFILQETACRVVDQPKLGHGCDGIDNNCDFVRDDCSEDQFPPTIDATLAVDTCAALGMIFPDNAAAQACIEKRVSAQDDCLPVNLSYATVATDACNPIVQVTATANGCGDRAALDITETTIPVRVDGVAPTVTCSVTNTVFKGNGNGVLRDAQFTYSVSDNCSPTVSVKIEVLSNEIDKASGDAVSISEPSGPTNEVNIFLQDLFCKNGNGSCNLESTQSSREYVVIVSATDEAGNVGICSDNVSVGSTNSIGRPLFSIDSTTFDVAL